MDQFNTGIRVTVNISSFGASGGGTSKVTVMIRSDSETSRWNSDGSRFFAHNGPLWCIPVHSSL